MTNFKKIFNICIGITLTVAIIFVILILVVKYNVEGESNLPFEIGKIVLVSSSEGIDKANDTNRWAFDLEQSNDIYIYIQGNDQYTKTEIIEKVILDNFKINKENQIGVSKIYRPSTQENEMFNNSEEYEASQIIYEGNTQTNIKELQISNQGGIAAFRVGNNNIGEYISNEQEEVDHTQLLKLANVDEQDLKEKVSFDITIELKGGKKYKTTKEIEFPVSGVVENGSTNKELTDLTDVVFKRITE